MNKLGSLGLIAFLAASSLACSVDRTASTSKAGYYFTGYVYDGVSNARLTGYDLTLSYADQTVHGRIGDDGKYWVGPLEPFNDYTIAVVATGYRDFYASEKFVAGRAPGTDGTESQIFEAVLFPSDLVSPALSLTLQTPDTGVVPDGTLRATPAMDVGESAINLQGDIEGSVTGQVWLNDADRKFETVVQPVEDGVVTFEEGALVYGVTYTATLFASSGYSFQNFSFTSGLTGDQSVTLSRTTEQPLAIVANSLDTVNLDDRATITLTFNQPVELSPLLDPSVVDEAIDQGFTINSPDLDADGEQNFLVDATDPTALESGAAFAIDGNTLTLSWGRRTANFETRDTDDPIVTATYANLGFILLRPVGGRANQEASLAALLAPMGGLPMGTLSIFVDARQNPPAP